MTDAARETLKEAERSPYNSMSAARAFWSSTTHANHDLQVRVDVLALLQNDDGKTAPEIEAGAHETVNSIDVRREPDGTCNRGRRCKPVANDDVLKNTSWTISYAPSRLVTLHRSCVENRCT